MPPTSDALVVGEFMLDVAVIEPSVLLLDACGLVGDGLAEVAACVCVACCGDPGAVLSVTGGSDVFVASSAVKLSSLELAELVADSEPSVTKDCAV